MTCFPPQGYSLEFMQFLLSFIAFFHVFIINISVSKQKLFFHSLILKKQLKNKQTNKDMTLMYTVFRSFPDVSIRKLLKFAFI